MKKIIQITSENMEEELSSITSFYNLNFPKAQHRKIFKRHIYSKDCYKALIFIIKSESHVIGLLESWIPEKRPDVRLFATLLVDEEFRNESLAKQMIERLSSEIKSIDEKLPMVVTFREYNKDTHVSFYKKFGFKKLILNGKYRNGDPMWEMRI
jgi:ribosomal protein S18 acetylase RimI-like enzyme